MSLITVQKKYLPSNLLKDRFIVPPFSILDSKQGYWRESVLICGNLLGLKVNLVEVTT